MASGGRVGAVAPTSLSGVELHVLLSLAGGPRHGYGVMEEVGSRTGGEVTLGAGTLYGALKRMRREGLIEERPGPAMAGEDGGSAGRRRYYGLSDSGRRALAEDVGRMSALVEQARLRGVEPRAGGPGDEAGAGGEDPILALADNPFEDGRVPADASTELDGYLYGRG